MLDDFPEHRFVKVEKVVEKVLKENNLQDLLYFSRILNNWEVIVGVPLAKKAIPLKLAKRTLHVGVVDSAYSHHLRFYESNIIELIASPEICGEGAVRKIVFKTTQKQINSPSAAAADVPPKVENQLSESEKERVDDTAGQIQDRQLQKIFSRYMGKMVNR